MSDNDNSNKWDAVDLVLDQFYEAVTTPESWTSALHALADLVSGLDAQLLLWSQSYGGSFVGKPRYLSVEGQEAYLSSWIALDPRRALTNHLPIGSIFACHEHFNEDYVRRSAFYQEFLVPDGGRFSAGGQITQGSDFAAYIVVHRGVNKNPFQRKELAILNQLSPHIGRAVRLHHEITQSRTLGQALGDALDRLPAGAIIVDAVGHVLTLNNMAEVILATGDGLTTRGGILSASGTYENGALLRLFAEAAHATSPSRGGTLRVRRPSGNLDYAIEVTPLAARSSMCAGWQKPLALMLISDLERRPVPLGRRLIDLFNLTPAEAQLAVALAEGKKLEEIAQERGVRMTTVRTQLRAALAKTETNRQSDLIGLVARLPITIGRVKK